MRSTRATALALFVLLLLAVPSTGQQDPFAIPPELSGQAVFSAAELTVNGNSTVDSKGVNASSGADDQGHVVSNADITLNGTSRVRGNATCGPGKRVRTNGASSVTGTRSELTTPRNPAPISLAGLATQLAAQNDNGRIGKTSKNRSPLQGSSSTELVLNGNETITIPAGTYYFTKITVNGSSQLSLSGLTRILCTGSVMVNGGSTVNNGGSPWQLRLWTSGTQVDLDGGSAVKGFVYAPSAQATIGGGAVLTGGVFASKVTINGGGKVTRSFDDAAPLAISVTNGGQPLADGSIFKTNVTPVVTVTGGIPPLTTRLTLDGGAFTSGSVVSTEGAHRLLVVVDDLAGRHLEAGVTFVIDKTAPRLTVVRPANGEVVAATPIDVYGTSDDAVTVTVNGATASPSGGSFVVRGVPLAEGSNALAVSGTDRAGNTGATTSSVVLDTQAPALTIIAPASGTITKDPSVIVQGSVSDAHLASLMVGGVPVPQPPGGGPFSVPVPLAEGTNVIVVEARDVVRHVTTRSIPVVRDSVKPVIRIEENGVPLQNGRAYNRSLTITVSVVEAHPDVLTVTLDGAPFTPGTTVSAEGEHTLSATARDKAGNSETVTVRFTIDKTAPSLSITAPAPGSTVTSLPRALEGTSGDAVAVDVNGTVVTPAAGRFAIAAFPFMEGPVTVTATGTDAAGNTGTATATYLVDTQAPQVAILAPLEGAILGAAPIFVTGTASDANLTGVSVNGQAASLGADGSFRAGPFSPADGPVTFTATATDRASRATSATRGVTVDTIPPVITIRNAVTSAPIAEDALFNTPITVAVSVTDGTTPAQTTHTTTLDGAPYAGGPVAGEGSHRVEVVARDGAGNTATASVSFTLDTTRPVFSALLPADGTIGRAAPVTVSGQVSADTESVTVAGQGATYAGGAFSRAGVALTEGPNDILLVATDRAGNQGTATLRLVLDTTSPAITIAAPAEGKVISSLAVTVSGTATDANLDTVSVEGGAAAVQPDGTFARAGVALVEGPNTLTATARDKAGNTASVSVRVAADSLPPSISITSPGSGAVLGQSPALVTGAVSDPHLDTVSVNGVPATVDGTGRFSASVPLTEGDNTLTATARDTLGHSAQASVAVSLDTAAPNVTITSPRDGTRFRTTPQTVRGTVDSPLNLEGVTVNGVAALLTGSTFEAPVALLEGTNTVTARARKTTGKEGTAKIDVVLDTAAPALTASSPADGQSGVSLSPEIRLTFSEALDASTVIASAFSLTASGGAAPALTASLGGAGSNVVTLLPAAPLEDARGYTLGVAATLIDLAGNALAAPLTIRFTTVDQTPPPAPALDPVPSLLCATTLTLTGTSEAGATISVGGGAAGAQATAGADGRFSVAVPLASGTAQTLSVTARDASGNLSAPATASVAVDCEPPHVLDVASSASALVVTFDEPVRPASIVAGETVRLDEAGGGVIRATAVLSDNDRTLTLGVSGIDLTAIGFTLSLSSGVTDRAGNALVPFVRTFAPQTTSTLLLGEVYDDAIGRPLGGATATLLVSGGSATAEPRPYATATASGSFVLPTLSGDALVRVSAPGTLDVYRRESVVAGGSGTPASATLFDARLTPLAEPATAKETTSGTAFRATFGSRSIALEAPAGSLPPGAVVRLTLRRPQGLPVLAPLGWSVASAVQVSLADASGAPLSASGSMTLMLPDFYGATSSTPLTFARLDPVSLQWLNQGSATLSSGALTTSVSSGGDWAVFVPDPAPTAPATPALGAPLPSASLPAEDPLESATVIADPVDVLPSQTADVSLTVTTPQPVPSGYPVQTLVTEELTLLDGSRLAGPSFLADLVLQRRGDGSLGLTTPVRASEGARRVALSVGYERFRVKKFPFEVRRGVVVGTSGGTVTGASGWSATLPSGAVSGATSIALTALGVAELPVGIPSGFDFFTAVRLTTGGVDFSLPVTLTYATTTPPASGRDILVVAFEDRGGFLIVRPVARASYDAGSQTVRSAPVNRAAFPWPGVRGEGTYAFLVARDPLAFVAGRVLDVDTAPLRDTLVSVGGSWALQAVSENDGTFALAIRAAASTLFAVRVETGNLGQLTVTPSAPAQEITGVELRLADTAPWVAGVTPSPGSTVLVGSRFTVTFSEPIDPLSITPTSLFLVATVQGQPVVVPAQTLVDPSGLSATLVPAAALPDNTSLALGVSRTVRDRNGYGLVDAITKRPADFAVTYTTEDLTPPDAKPWLVRISLPTGDPIPTITITGAPGAVCGGCHVVAYNDTTLATASTDAQSDGSFSLTLAARATDSIRVEIQKPNGTRQTLPPVPFTNDGGRTVLVGGKGGSWETPDGFRITVPAAAFAGPVNVVTERIPQATFQTLVAPPRDAVSVDAFQMDFSIPATSGFDLSFAAPGTSATDQFFLAQVVEVLGQKRLMVVDLLVRQSGRLVTDRSGTLQSLREQGYVALLDPKATAVGGVVRVDAQLLSVQALAGPGSQIDDPKSFFDGVFQRGQYAVYNAAVQMATVAGTLGAGNTVATSSSSDFVFDSTQALDRTYFRLFCPVGNAFDLTLVDRDSGLTLFQGGFGPPTGTSTVLLLNPPNPDQLKPGVLLAGPAPLYRFDAPSDGSAPFAIARGISATSTELGNDVVVSVKVDGGAVPEGTLLRLVNFNRFGAGETAATSGTSTVTLPGARAGDPLGFTIENRSAPIASSLVIAFDEEMKKQGDNWKNIVSIVNRTSADGSTCPAVGYRFIEKPTSGAGVKELLVVADIKDGWLRSGCRYTLYIGEAAEDLAGNRMANPVQTDFALKDDEPIGSLPASTFVRKLLYHGGLLLATGEDQAIRVYDARVPGTIGSQCDMRAPTTPPANPAACPTGATTREVPLPGVGRDLAVDRFGRLIVVGGGTADSQGASPGLGFLRLYDFVPMCGSPTYDCGRRLAPRGTTVISAAIGDATLTYPPQGTPRRIALQEEVQERFWRVDADDNAKAELPATGTKITLTLPVPTCDPPIPTAPAPVLGIHKSGSGERQGYRQLYTITSSSTFPPSPRCHKRRFFSFTNLATGETVNARTDENGAGLFPVAGGTEVKLTASSGDRIRMVANGASVAVVDVLGYGLAFVDLDAVYDADDVAGAPPSETDPTLASKLLLAYTGSSPSSAPAGSPNVCRDGSVTTTPKTCDEPYQRCGGQLACNLLASINNLAPAGSPPVYEYALSDLLALTGIAVKKSADVPGLAWGFGSLNGFGLLSFSIDLRAADASAGPSLRMGRERTFTTGQGQTATIRNGHLVGLVSALPLKPSGMATPVSARANDVALAENVPPPAQPWFCRGSWERGAASRDLAFVAAGNNGVYVVDVTNPAWPKEMGRYETKGGALAVSADATRKLLYVSDAGEGMKVFSFEDPCGATPGTSTVVDDPRLVASYPPATGSLGNTPISVDPDTGIVYGSATGSGTSAVSGFDLVPPPLYAVADTDGDGKLEVVSEAIPLGVPNPVKKAAVGDPAAPTPDHDPYVPEAFSVLAFLPGGDPILGKFVKVDVSATTFTGGALPESAPGFPKSKLEDLRLTRQSDDPSDPAYNRYQSDPIILIADPRAQHAYTRSADEDDTANVDACRNCIPAADLAPRLLTQPDPDGRLELLSGERIRIRFTDELKTTRPHLADLDLDRTAFELTSIRADLTPGLKQAPVLSGNSVLGVETSSREYATSAADLTLTGRGLDLTIDRTYRSQVLHDGPFGRNQDSSLFERLRELPTGDVEYYDGSARRHIFTTAEKTGYDSPAGIASVLSKTTTGSFVLVHSDKSQTLFDATGRKRAFRDRHVTGASDESGNRHRFEYDGEGRLVAVVDDAGRRTSLIWHETTRRLKSVEDFDGRVVGYNINSGRLDDVTGPDPEDASGEQPKTWYKYSEPAGGFKARLYANGQLGRITEGAETAPAAFDIGYDPGGIAKSVKTVDGMTEFRPGMAASSTDVVDPKSAKTTFVYQAAGQVLTVTDPANNTTLFSYKGSLTSKGHPRADGLPETVTLPEGQIVVYAYGGLAGTDRTRHFDLTAVERRPKGGTNDVPLTTAILYDNHGLPISVTQSDLSPTSPAAPLITMIGRKANGDVTSITEPGKAAVGITPDSKGRPISISDATGRTETRGYDDRPGYTGQLASVSVSGGSTTPVSTTYTRDTRGNVLSTRDSTGRTVTFDVNKLDQTYGETRGGTSPGRTTYRFYATGQVKDQTRVLNTPHGQDPVTSVTSYAYDPLGRLKTRTPSGSGQTIYTYDGQGNLERVTTPQGFTRYGYDPRGLLTSVTPSTGGATLYGYNNNGTRTSSTNPRRGITEYRLDGHDRTKGSYDQTTRSLEESTVDGFGRVRSRKTYEATSPPDSLLALYNWTEYEYDTAGRQKKEIRKLFSSPLPSPFTGPFTDVVTESVYDAHGRVSAVVDPLGRTTRTDYDEQGRVKKTTDPAGNEVVTEYDAAGNRRMTIVREKKLDGSGFDEYETESFYDDRNRLWKVVEHGLKSATLPRERTYEYDQAGRKTKETDPDGGATTFEYDTAGRKTKETDPLGAVTLWDYDQATGNLVRLTDANGNKTTYAYDSEGRLTFETRGDPVQTGDSPSLPTWKTTYDDMGNRATIKDPNGTVVTFHYDAAGRLTGRTIAKAPTVEGPTDEAKTLDPLGRLTAWTSTGSGVDQAGTATFDSLDRMTEETLRLGGAGGALRTIGHDYDLAGNETALTYPSGRRYALEPDPLGRLREVRDPGGLFVVRYEDAGSRQTRKTFGNNLVEERTYGSAPWLKTLSVSLPQTSPVLSLDYANRNLRGLKLDVLRADRGTKDTYNYDAAGRITQENLGLPEPPPSPPAVATSDIRNVYTLDGLLNLRKRERTQAGTTIASEPGANASGINSRNQYTQWGTSPTYETLTHDPNGNLTSYQGTTLRYDVDNRMSTATTATGTYKAFHDSNGQRVREVRTAGGSTVELDVVQSGQRVLEVFPKDGLTPIQRYVYGRAIDEVVLAEMDPNATGTTTALYPLQDELGNVTHLTDASGSVVERYQYEGYGKFRIFDPSNSPRTVSSFGWNRLFQGREYIGIVDAYDFRARILWPEIGRFGQEDPAGAGDSTNRYQALLGTWTALTDPSGFEVTEDEIVELSNYTPRTMAARIGTEVHRIWQEWMKRERRSVMGPHERTSRLRSAYYDSTLSEITGSLSRVPRCCENRRPDAARVQWREPDRPVTVWELKPESYDVFRFPVMSAFRRYNAARKQVSDYVYGLNPGLFGSGAELHSSVGDDMAAMIQVAPGVQYRIVVYSQPGSALLFYRLELNGQKPDEPTAMQKGLRKEIQEEQRRYFSGEGVPGHLLPQEAMPGRAPQLPKMIPEISPAIRPQPGRVRKAA